LHMRFDLIARIRLLLIRIFHSPVASAGDYAPYTR
jgi:hypothetical protein